MAHQNVEATDTLNQGRVKLNANDIELYADVAAAAAAAAAAQANIDSHEALTNNPHSVTASQIGLGNATDTSDANKPVSTAQQAALDLKQNLNSTFDRKTDTDYTLVLTDNGKAIEMDSTSAHTLTVPLNSSVPFPVGANIPVIKYNTGTVTIVATGGVTINSSSGTLIIESQHSAALLQKVGTNEWRLLNGSPGLTWTALAQSLTGWSSVSSYDVTYIIQGKLATIKGFISGTGNSSAAAITNLPFTLRTSVFQPIWVTNNVTQQTGRADITGGTTTLTFRALITGTAFTDAVTRTVQFQIIGEIA